MEYERALFRVYERCLEGFIPNNPDNSTKSCEIIEHLVFTVTAAFIGILIFLHLIFVGNTGCLPAKLSEYALAHHNSSTLNFTNDQIIQIFIDSQESLFFDQSDYLGRRERRRLRSRFSQQQQNLDESQFHYLNISNSTNFTSVNDTIADQMIIPDYQFATNWAVLQLSDEIRKDHNFEMINISYTSKCFGTPLQQNFLPFGGIDVIVLNNVMASIPSGGILTSLSGESYSWQRSALLPPQTFLDWFSFKISILTKGLFSYFILSATTALVVRILISSGVVLLLPFFWALQLCGLHVLNSRIFTLSYPWLGVPMEILRIRQQSTAPFLISHITRVFLYYLMYEASQFALSYWLYDEDPGPKELWLYAMMMILEYYSMIYLRSSLAIQFFPPVTLLLYLLYHIYLFSYPSGFHLLALLCLFLSFSHLMIFTLRKFEFPAFLRGVVTIETPRARYNALPWPAWSVALAPDSTLFLPLTHRSRSIYDVVPGNDENGGDADLPIPVPPNYNSVATFIRRNPPMPTSMGEGHQSENSEAETEEDEEDEERKDQVEFVSRTRHAFDSFFGRLQEAMDESDSEADTTMTPMLRSVNHPQAIVHEERNEGRAQEGGPHHDPHPSSRDIEMGPRDHSHNV